jgi:hypothetical protein
MRIKKTQLKQIIKEELQTVLEFDFDDYEQRQMASIAGKVDIRQFKTDVDLVVKELEKVSTHKSTLMRYESFNNKLELSETEFRKYAGAWADRHFTLIKLLKQNAALVGNEKNPSPPLGAPALKEKVNEDITPTEAQIGVKAGNAITQVRAAALILLINLVGYTNRKTTPTANQKAVPKMVSSQPTTKYYSYKMANFILQYLLLADKTWSRKGSPGVLFNSRDDLGGMHGDISMLRGRLKDMKNQEDDAAGRA